jgi:hypothetical protein
MNFGHSPRAFIEDGPTEQVAKAESMRSTARSWRVLDEARRIELVERALSAANDCFDGFPIAL